MPQRATGHNAPRGKTVVAAASGVHLASAAGPLHSDWLGSVYVLVLWPQPQEGRCPAVSNSLTSRVIWE